MAIAKPFLGFNDLGCLVTPIFLLMDYFLYRFYTFREKNKENLLTKSSVDFLQNAPSNSVNSSSWFFCGTDFKCLLKG